MCEDDQTFKQSEIPINKTLSHNWNDNLFYPDRIKEFTPNYDWQSHRIHVDNFNIPNSQILPLDNLKEIQISLRNDDIIKEALLNNK